MKKQLLSGLLCAALILGLSLPAGAAETTEAIQVLSALDIMTGDDSGDLALNRPVTRAEFTKLTIAASPYRDTVGPTASVSPYSDVPRQSWAAPWVQCAKENRLVRGYLDGSFRPDASITLVEGVSMALSLLGYQNSDFSGAWGSGQMALYQTLKLDRNISTGRDEAMTRRDALWLFYNLLTAKTKSGQVYLTTLGHALTASGEIDRVALVNAAMEGPLVAEGDWKTALPFQAEGASVYRNGTPAALSSIRPLDVVYYSKSMRTLWAWSDKVTGAIQQIAPSASAPASVTVGGKSYGLETAAARYDLSDLGRFHTGQTVTLLLGRDGGVAAVRSASESTVPVYGIVTATGTDSYTDQSGKRYTADTLYLCATDGQTYTYQWTDPNKGKQAALEPGNMVQVISTAQEVQVTALSPARLTGTLDAQDGTLGDHTLAANVEILDTYGKAGHLRVYPSRLDGVRFTGEMVRYYALNGQGEISHLILNDVTGDLHQYGVLTGVSETSAGMTISSIYTYDIAGTPGSYTDRSHIWNLSEGPCMVRLDGAAPDRVFNLSGLALTGVEGNTAFASNRRLTIADAPAIYEKRDKTYYLTDLDRVSGGGWTLTGYYDKPQQEGGRVRVIVAEAVE